MTWSEMDQGIIILLCGDIEFVLWKADDFNDRSSLKTFAIHCTLLFVLRWTNQKKNLGLSFYGSKWQESSWKLTISWIKNS